MQIQELKMNILNLKSLVMKLKIINFRSKYTLKGVKWLKTAILGFYEYFSIFSEIVKIDKKNT